jgi:hypothetical protein
MQTAKQGDRVQVHNVKRFQDGSVASFRSRGRPPLELTVGTHHPRLPGLGLSLVGLAPGNHVTVNVPAERASGLPRARQGTPAAEHAVLGAPGRSRRQRPAWASAWPSSRCSWNKAEGR